MDLIVRKRGGRRKNGRRRNRPNRGMRAEQYGFMANPPQYSSTSKCIRKTRYFLTAATLAGEGTPVYWHDIFTTWGMACSTTVFKPLAQAVRLVKVEAWGPGTPGATPIPTTMSIRWGDDNIAGIASNDMVVNDTVVVGSQVSHVVAKPPKKTQTEGWISDTNGSICFSIFAQQGAVIDVTIEYVFCSWLVPNTYTTVAGVVGTVSTLFLDSFSGQKKMQPMDIVQTV